MKFELNKEQVEKLDKWKEHCKTYAGAIGGRISITFTPTGLGTCIEAKCICGEKIDLTDAENW